MAAAVRVPWLLRRSNIGIPNPQDNAFYFSDVFSSHSNRLFIDAWQPS